ncbi:efflux RND transporter periplasmic adaptor subunit [Mucilaginibacter sp. McL0603]|uniref:efflux RND transporter periplasmic adaptor subunit n=1 Tax=Mucilaginibacter sp. McL0603 TaxID=3415670 RepID=UPI003CF2362C
MVTIIARNLLICCFCLFFICCKDKSSQSLQAPKVNAVVVGKKDIAIYDVHIGQIYGESDVQIQPRVEGSITGIFFKEGDVVPKGKLLYTIDDLPTQTKIDAAKSDVSRAQAIMENKKSDLSRIQPLADMNALSKRDLDAASAAYKVSQDEVKIAQARLANANIELGYTHITSPITGVIGISKVLVGDYVSRVAFGGGINTVSALGDVRVRFTISENEYLRFVQRIRKDPKSNNFSKIPVDLILGDGSVYAEKGRIDLTNRQIDPSTGSLLVQAVFGNKQKILRPGQYVKVRFQSDVYKNATVVPQQCVNQLQNIYQVFLLNDSNKITPTVVKVGNRVGSNWIITEGVKPGDKVVMVGSASINPNTPVDVVTMNWNYDSTTKN